MIIGMELLNRQRRLTGDAFRHHWREIHGPIVSELPGLCDYVQHHVVESVQRGISYTRGPEQLDGFSELTFEDSESMNAAFASDVGSAVAAAEQVFLDRARIVTVLRREVISPDPAKALIKRMSLLRRRQDVDPETFDREWRKEHARLVRLTPGVRGYRQNLITERQVVRGISCGYDELPIDGIVELWFSNLDELDAAFASPEGVELMGHATTFIDEITTFMVERHDVFHSHRAAADARRISPHSHDE